MEKVIGIISYLPDENSVRRERINRLTKLIGQCDKLFNLPIIIIAQNWKDFSVSSENCQQLNYDKLGIVGARKELRRVFLKSSYDVLIMLDDDCNIIGTEESGRRYLGEIDYYGMGHFGEFKGTQLKLFSITRDLLNKVDFDDVNPEKEEGFEDTVFARNLEKNYGEKMFVFDYSNNLHETSVGVNDNYSTWYKNQNLSLMLNRTQERIKKL